MNLIDVIDRLGTLHKAELRTAAAKHDLPLVQLETLHYLDRCNRYSDTPSAITEYLNLTKGTVSQTIRTLEKKGFLLKEKDPADGRKVHCTLSRLGRAVVDDTQPPQALTTAVEALDEDRAVTTRDGLHKILNELQASTGNKTFGSCPECIHLQAGPTGYRCGSTDDRIREHELALLCRLHDPSA